jgi:hypothetical protein
MWVLLRWIGLLLLVLPGSRAYAWTQARVVEAHVVAAPAPEGHHRVAVELLLHVESGWVATLEVPGFDGMTGLDTDTEAVWTTPDGEEIPLGPTVGTQGTLRFDFARATAPRRGEHRLRFAYLAEGAVFASADGVRIGYTLPGWEAGLRRASVTLALPTGARAVVDPTLAFPARVQEAGPNARVIFERIHVPRNTAWTVFAELPRGPMRPRSAELQHASSMSPRAQIVGLGVAIAVLGVSHAARSVRRRRDRRAGAQTTGRITLPRGVAELTAMAGALCWGHSLAGACLCWFMASLALALLPSERDLALTAFGHPTRIPREALPPVREDVWRRAGSPFDATTPLGVATVALLLSAPAWFDGAHRAHGSAWGLGLLCALPSWFTGSRLDGVLDREAQIRALMALARATTISGWALSLRWMAGKRGGSAPFVRLTSNVPLVGVHRVELCAPRRRDAPPRVRICLDPALVDGVRTQLCAAPDALTRGVGGRTLLEAQVPDFEAFLRWLVRADAERSRERLGAASANRPSSPEAQTLTAPRAA